MHDDDDLPFKVVRVNGHDEIVARAVNLLIGRAAYETARRLYPVSGWVTATARGSLLQASRKRRRADTRPAAALGVLADFCAVALLLTSSAMRGEQHDWNGR
jgi:hypothetical protein